MCAAVQETPHSEHPRLAASPCAYDPSAASILIPGSQDFGIYSAGIPWFLYPEHQSLRQINPFPQLDHCKYSPSFLWIRLGPLRVRAASKEPHALITGHGVGNSVRRLQLLQPRLVSLA